MTPKRLKIDILVSDSMSKDLESIKSASGIESDSELVRYVVRQTAMALFASSVNSLKQAPLPELTRPNVDLNTGKVHVYADWTKVGEKWDDEKGESYIIIKHNKPPFETRSLRESDPGYEEF